MSEAAEAPDEALEPDAIVPEAAAPEETPQTAKPDKAREQIEAAARQAGWAPADEWKGDPGDHLDAPEFILKAVGEVLPSMRKTLQESKAEVARLSRTLKDFGEHHSKTEQRAYERAAKDIQARLDAAATLGDVQGVRDATDELVELHTEAKAAKPPEPAAATDPAFDDWTDANAWWNKDKVMTAAAVAIANDIEVTEGLKSGPRFYAEVDKRIRAEFPHKFENPNRRLPGAVEAPGAPRSKAAKSFNDLPADAKAMCLSFEKDIKGFKRETYVKDYFA
jgi:hypothetical protein